jgi:formamidopyrimidine-DNA glycosylase
MPELPDLLHMQQYLRAHVVGRTITTAEVRQPIVLRNAIGDPPELVLKTLTITGLTVNGPFIRFTISSTLELVVNLMLAGRIQHQRKPDKTLGHLCMVLHLSDGTRLNFCDEQKMMKVYLVHSGVYNAIPNYTRLGLPIMEPAFTEDALLLAAKEHSRKQVRVFINDHTILNSIGNAYADEILFAAGIHPKTIVASLSSEDLRKLHTAITDVMAEGITAVAQANQPIHVKVRDHMKVRNRKGLPCPKCGTTIRREGVRGYDVFFCPTCQPVRRKVFIDWSTIPPAGDPE